MNMFRRSAAAGFLCLGLAVFAASPASAQTAYNAAEVAPPGIAVTGNVLSTSGVRVQAPTGSAQVLSLQVSQANPVPTGGQARSTGLAFTGADLVSLLLIAVPLILVGLALTRQGRLRPAPPG